MISLRKPVSLRKNTRDQATPPANPSIRYRKAV